VADADELIDDGGKQRNSVLLLFDLFRNTYFHCRPYIRWWVIQQSLTAGNCRFVFSNQ